jgi:hypothetical protein
LEQIKVTHHLNSGIKSATKALRIEPKPAEAGINYHECAPDVILDDSHSQQEVTKQQQSR